MAKPSTLKTNQCSKTIINQLPAPLADNTTVHLIGIQKTCLCIITCQKICFQLFFFPTTFPWKIGSPANFTLLGERNNRTKTLSSNTSIYFDSNSTQTKNRLREKKRSAEESKTDQNLSPCLSSTGMQKCPANQLTRIHTPLVPDPTILKDGVKIPQKTQAKDIGVSGNENKMSQLIDDLMPCCLPHVKYFRLSQFGKNLVTSLQVHSVLPSCIQHGQIFLVKCILTWFVAILTASFRRSKTYHQLLVSQTPAPKRAVTSPIPSCYRHPAANITSRLTAGITPGDPQHSLIVMSNTTRTQAKAYSHCVTLNKKVGLACAFPLYDFHLTFSSEYRQTCLGKEGLILCFGIRSLWCLVNTIFKRLLHSEVNFYIDMILQISFSVSSCLPNWPS